MRHVYLKLDIPEHICQSPVLFMMLGFQNQSTEECRNSKFCCCTALNLVPVHSGALGIVLCHVLLDKSLTHSNKGGNEWEEDLKLKLGLKHRQWQCLVSCFRAKPNVLVKSSIVSCRCIYFSV